MRQLSGVWAVSHYTLERMYSLGLPRRGHDRVLYNCLDPGFAIPNDVPRPRAGPFRLLSVSRLGASDSYKGHAQVLAALKRVPEVQRRLEWIVIGDGELRRHLENQAHQLGLSGIVHFLGRVSDSELTDWYKKVNAFVLPSVGEGFGIVFLEAMAHGLPVIAGEQDASSEVVVHGEPGLIVDPHRPEAIADGIDQLAIDRTRAERMGRAGAKRVQERFRYEHLRSRVRESGGRVVLCNLSDVLKEMFETTRLLINPRSPKSLFEYANTLEDALEMLSNQP